MTEHMSHSKSIFGGKSAKSILLGSAATLAFAGFATPAMAQDAEELDESNVITVIARKQTETLQEVPVTVTAIGGDTLEKFQVNEIADVTSRVPALNVQVGGSGSGGQISLRGVGSSNISASFDSAVAFDFDGVQVSTMRMVQAGFFDVEQIDVLKGPQSLFFGKSASAGVFSVRSADPTASWEIGTKVSHEFEENGTTISGHISGPISDTLGIRVAAQLNSIEDYVKLAPGTPAFNPNGSIRDSRGLESFVGRTTLQWDPADNFSANLKLNYVKNKNDGAIAHSDINCGANGVADPIFLLSGGVIIPSNADCNDSDGLYHHADGATALISQAPDGSAGDPRFNNGIPFGETEIFFGRLKWDLDLSDSLTLSSVSGYLSLDAVDTDCYGYVGQFASGAPGGVGCSDPRNATEQFTQELRVSSDFDGMFNFMVGAFYESRDIDFNTSQQGVNISLLAADPVTGNTYDWYKKQNTKTEALSFFASATLDLTDQLQVSGGVRWTDENKTSRISVPYVHTFLSSGPAFIPSGFFSGPIDFSDDNFSPELSIRYQATPDINIYGAFKTGFKSGGIDNSALPSSSLLGFNDPDPATRQAVADALKFKSETGLGGEIGVKAQFADRAVTLNTSVFYYVFDDLQVQNFDATTVQFQTFNASQLTSQGVDVEWAWRTPVEGLSFSGAFAYTDATFTAPFVTTSGEDLDGRAAARAPKFAANAAFDWSTPLGDSLELGLNGNVQYSGSYFTNEDSLNDLKQDSYVSIDGSISVGDPDGAWKLSLVGVNLTDEIWINTTGGRPFLAPAGNGFGLPAGDDLVVTQNRGRQVFVEASFTF
ncbi:TonB-dependent receptor [Parasphingorhabdus sp.]|uniref:TonB-dependent receptor n=1 Tax=Parasphingorhabdus sp. TaxID=2709688 RepID=UPI003264E265